MLFSVVLLLALVAYASAAIGAGTYVNTTFSGASVIFQGSNNNQTLVLDGCFVRSTSGNIQIDGFLNTTVINTEIYSQSSFIFSNGQTLTQTGGKVTSRNGGSISIAAAVYRSTGVQYHSNSFINVSGGVNGSSTSITGASIKTPSGNAFTIGQTNSSSITSSTLQIGGAATFDGRNVTLTGNTISAGDIITVGVASNCQSFTSANNVYHAHRDFQSQICVAQNWNGDVIDGTRGNPSTTLNIIPQNAAQSGNPFTGVTINGFGFHLGGSAYGAVNLVYLNIVGSTINSPKANVQITYSTVTSSTVLYHKLQLYHSVTLNNSTFSTNAEGFDHSTNGGPGNFQVAGPTVLNNVVINAKSIIVFTGTGSLTHGSGRNELNLALGGSGGDTQPQVLVITGPTFSLTSVAEAVGDRWKFTVQTNTFACTGDVYGTANNTVLYITTPSNANCLDFQRRNGLPATFNCQTANLYFYPRSIPSWHTIEPTYVSHFGPRVCASTSSLSAVNGPYSIAGISLHSTQTYILSQAFSTYPGDLPTRVYAGDFDPINARVTSVVEITPPSSRRAPTIAHVYQITTTTACDGTSILRYGGTVHRAGPSFTVVPNHGGMDWAIRSSIYAGCLGNQFCF